MVSRWSMMTFRSRWQINGSGEDDKRFVATFHLMYTGFSTETPGAHPFCRLLRIEYNLYGSIQKIDSDPTMNHVNFLEYIDILPFQTF